MPAMTLQNMLCLLDVNSRQSNSNGNHATVSRIVTCCMGYEVRKPPKVNANAEIVPANLLRQKKRAKRYIFIAVRLNNAMM